MRKTSWIISGLGVGLLLSGGAAFAAGSPQATPAQGAGSDQEFLKQALGVNQLEVELGRLAAERANTPQVKATGQKMVQNHTAIGQQLADLAQQAGLSANAQLSPEQLETLSRVESQSGSAFDTAFKQTVDTGHVKELAMYRDEVSRAANPQLRALAEQRVTALERAVAEAEKAKKSKQPDER